MLLLHTIEFEPLYFYYHLFLSIFKISFEAQGLGTEGSLRPARPDALFQVLKCPGPNLALHKDKLRHSGHPPQPVLTPTTALCYEMTHQHLIANIV